MTSSDNGCVEDEVETTENSKLFDNLDDALNFMKTLEKDRTERYVSTKCPKDFGDSGINRDHRSSKLLSRPSVSPPLSGNIVISYSRIWADFCYTLFFIRMSEDEIS